MGRFHRVIRVWRQYKAGLLGFCEPVQSDFPSLTGQVVQPVKAATWFRAAAPNRTGDKYAQLTVAPARGFQLAVSPCGRQTMPAQERIVETSSDAPHPLFW